MHHGRACMPTPLLHVAAADSLAAAAVVDQARHGKKPLSVQCTVCRDHYIPTTEDGIPTGQITPVKGTPFDFTEMKRVGKDIDETPGGYDHNWVLHGLGRQAKFSTKAGSVATET